MPTARLDALLVATGPDDVSSAFGTLQCRPGASVDVATLALTNALDITLETC
jgi:hypothetical protein